MAKRKEDTQGEGTKLNPVDAEETEFQQETIEESSIAKVNLITSEKKVTMSAPVKEFDDFKHSFQSMMTAFANFIEAAGLEIGQDETNAQIIMMKSEFERLRKDTQTEGARMREGSVSRSDLEALKAEEAKNREGSVPRNEFEEHKAAIMEAITDKDAKLLEDYVTRGEFETFRRAVREVM